MKLYVPELGDKLQLNADWTFELHAESRNVKLIEFFGHYHVYQFGIIDAAVLPPLREPDYVIEYPKYEQFSGPFVSSTTASHKWNEACRKIRMENQGFLEFNKEREEWKAIAKDKGVPFMTVTLPKGVVLTVDRIYIRKGNSEFSSLSFYVEGLGQSKMRFWAKLADCNNIEFEKP